MVEEPQENYTTGYIKLYRSLQNSYEYWLSEKFTKGQAWIDLIMMAQFKDGNKLLQYQLVQLKRGQLLTSKRRLSDRWRWDRTTVDRYLRVLQADHMINYTSNHHFTIVTICNYDTYQQSNYIGTTTISTSSTTTNNTTTQPRRSHDAATTQPRRNTYNNDNNVNKDKNVKKGERAHTPKEEKINQFLGKCQTLYENKEYLTRVAARLGRLPAEVQDEIEFFKNDSIANNKHLNGNSQISVEAALENWYVTPYAFTRKKPDHG